MAQSKIEWTDYTWNPVTGCTPVSPGCRNCYAKRMAQRLRGRCGYPADEPFRVTLHPERLEEPLRWRKPRRVFVCSMGDLFHEDVPDSLIAEVFAIAQMAWRHRFLFLTKRPERMAKLLANSTFSAFREMLANCYANRVDPDAERGDLDFEHALEEGLTKNVWLGVTAENQEMLDLRVPHLLRCPAAVRFVSNEPSLGLLILPSLGHASPQTMVDWLIVGGETGPGARPMDIKAARYGREQAVTADIPYFFKGHGEWLHESQLNSHADPALDFGRYKTHRWPDGTFSYRVGKKIAGRLLDGRTWEEVPNVAG